MKWPGCVCCQMCLFVMDIENNKIGHHIQMARKHFALEPKNAREITTFIILSGGLV